MACHFVLQGIFRLRDETCISCTSSTGRPILISSEVLISKIHKKLPWLNSHKTKQKHTTPITHLKTGKENKYNSPKKMYKWPTGIRKRGSASLIIREMRIKTTVRYQVTTVRMVNIRKTKENNYWQECGEKGTLGYCWCKLVRHCGKQDFPGSSSGKESACNVGNLGSVPGLGRSPGGGNGNPLQYSCLENLMDRGALQATVHGVTSSWTWLSDWAQQST